MEVSHGKWVLWRTLSRDLAWPLNWETLEKGNKSTQQWKGGKRILLFRSHFSTHIIWESGGVYNTKGMKMTLKCILLMRMTPWVVHYSYTQDISAGISLLTSIALSILDALFNYVISLLQLNTKSLWCLQRSVCRCCRCFHHVFNELGQH